MPTRIRSRRLLQPVLNTLTAAILLLSTPALAPDVADHPVAAQIAIEESASAETLASQLPLELTFTDRMGVAAFAATPTPLDPDGAERISTYRAGDIAYRAAEQSVVVFLSDGTAVPDDDLVLLGHVTRGLDTIAGCVRDCVVQLVVDSTER